MATANTEITYRQAVIRALAEELRADDAVVVLGEDVAAAGGVFKATEGLLAEFGQTRVRDTPISETAIIGAALGAALNGLRPVAEMMFADFVQVAMDQLVNQVSKYRYMTGGQVEVPLVVRAVCGAGFGFAAQHSGCPEAWFMHAPGWRIVAPSTPEDAYWLLRAAIRSSDPVLFLEHKYLYGQKGTVGDRVPEALDRAVTRRPGTDVTVIATMVMAHRAMVAAEHLRAEGISAEVIDLRFLAPLDYELVLGSARRTGRLVTVEENPRECGWGAEVVATTAERLGVMLRGVRRVTAPSTPIPFSPPLEQAWMPRPDDVVSAVRSLMPT
jgi:acetoin:2,6-dichlorophenolindophenol oxidoreductase subunit beta